MAPARLPFTPVRGIAAGVPSKTLNNNEPKKGFDFFGSSANGTERAPFLLTLRGFRSARILSGASVPWPSLCGSNEGDSVGVRVTISHEDRSANWDGLFHFVFITCVMSVNAEEVLQCICFLRKHSWTWYTTNQTQILESVGKACTWSVTLL